jgi:hypothetical protein
MRCESVDLANHYLTMMYGEMPEVTCELHTCEWAMIASLNGGEISAKHRVIRNPDLAVNPLAYNRKIFDAGLATQSYDKGLDRFTAKFDPNVEMSAVVAIEPCCHFDHGTAIYFSQEKRRCVLTNTLYGLTDDESLSYTLQAWAKFQPRLAKPRCEPGQLYYPAAYTHVFQKYWDHLDNPTSHPNCDESEFTKDAMNEFAQALSGMNLRMFEPKVDAEADDKSCHVAQNAAISRCCPIQDATDYWGGQVEAVTGSGGPAPGQDRHNVDT